MISCYDHRDSTARHAMCCGSKRGTISSDTAVHSKNYPMYKNGRRSGDYSISHEFGTYGCGSRMGVVV